MGMGSAGFALGNASADLISGEGVTTAGNGSVNSTLSETKVNFES